LRAARCRRLNKRHDTEVPRERPPALIVAEKSLRPNILHRRIKNPQVLFDAQAHAPLEQVLERPHACPTVPPSWKSHQLQNQVGGALSVDRGEGPAPNLQSIVEPSFVCGSFAVLFDPLNFFTDRVGKTDASLFCKAFIPFASPCFPNPLEIH